MRKFAFGGIVRKYNVPYVFVRPASGYWDEDGVWIPAKEERVSLQGHFQPVSAKLQQEEGGNYTEEDRTLYTASKHSNGDRIEYQDNHYTVDTAEVREYSDINKYMLKKVVRNDSVQGDPVSDSP
ncbi:hypothetical protein [Paenibacillus polymyxa]|uniref:hypothetical protein n=1 Tax=Paenibacillus polymyxa TaxID=1406 RepID=UPI0008CB7378|nr:hypothetical protein [Paenibacillus polymyxa]SEI75512.1 hypothetical protein SAMN04488600_101590 [Paenibacillus polymyxa]